jgi:NAD(P)-dependent dehydrogenase (short-subunit alcohol dehydrogenase family)
MKTYLVTGASRGIGMATVKALVDQAAYINGTVITVDGGDMAKSYILDKESELLG